MTFDQEMSFDIRKLRSTTNDIQKDVDYIHRLIRLPTIPDDVLSTMAQIAMNNSTQNRQEPLGKPHVGPMGPHVGPMGPFNNHNQKRSRILHIISGW